MSIYTQQHKKEYTRFRSFLMRNLKAQRSIHMSRSLCSVFENTSAQSDYVAGRLLVSADNSPKLREALLKWHPTVMTDSGWLASKGVYIKSIVGQGIEHDT